MGAGEPEERRPGLGEPAQPGDRPALRGAHQVRERRGVGHRVLDRDDVRARVEQRAQSLRGHGRVAQVEHDAELGHRLGDRAVVGHPALGGLERVRRLVDHDELRARRAGVLRGAHRSPEVEPDARHHQRVARVLDGDLHAALGLRRAQRGELARVAVRGEHVHARVDEPADQRRVSLLVHLPAVVERGDRDRDHGAQALRDVGQQHELVYQYSVNGSSSRGGPRRTGGSRWPDQLAARPDDRGNRDARDTCGRSVPPPLIRAGGRGSRGSR